MDADMSNTGTVINERVFAALRASAVANEAGISSATWASATTPRVFNGLVGYLAGRSRGRLPFIEFSIDSQGFNQEHFQGGTVSSVLTIRAHCSGRDMQVASDLLRGILTAALSSIRDEAGDNYTAFGSDDMSAVQPGPWGHMQDATVTMEHTFDRTDYEVN